MEAVLGTLIKCNFLSNLKSELILADSVKCMSSIEGIAANANKFLFEADNHSKNTALNFILCSTGTLGILNTLRDPITNILTNKVDNYILIVTDSFSNKSNDIYSLYLNSYGLIPLTTTTITNEHGIVFTVMLYDSSKTFVNQYQLN